MGPNGALFGVCLCGLGFIAASVGWAWRAEQRLAACHASNRDLRRLLRLAAADIQAPVLGLLGHAAHVPAPLAASLIGVCRDMLALAEALLAHTDEPGLQRIVTLEDIALGPMVDFVVAHVAGQLGPGRRAWRIDPRLTDIVLPADRRALHQVLLRLLTGAALATGDGDSIAISAATTDAGLAITIEDEGTGMAASRISGAPLETRGLGVGMALVRTLMRAHGGSLAFESAALVGTRAILRFPRNR